MNVKHMLVVPVLAAIASAQVVIPDGTKMRLRLDQTLSSGTADEGQTVELSVAEAVTVDGVTVVQEGARATGTVVLAQEKRRMGTRWASSTFQLIASAVPMGNGCLFDTPQ
jgi:hypothetical protein